MEPTPTPEDLRLRIDWPATSLDGDARHDPPPAIAVDVRTDQAPIPYREAVSGLARLAEETSATRARLDTLTEAIAAMRSIVADGVEDLGAAVAGVGLDSRSGHDRVSSDLHQVGGSVAESLNLVADRLERLVDTDERRYLQVADDLVDGIADALDDVGERLEEVQMSARSRHDRTFAMLRSLHEATTAGARLEREAAAQHLREVEASVAALADEVRRGFAEVRTAIDRSAIDLTAADGAAPAGDDTRATLSGLPTLGPTQQRRAAARWS